MLEHYGVHTIYYACFDYIRQREIKSGKDKIISSHHVKYARQQAECTGILIYGWAALQAPCLKSYSQDENIKALQIFMGSSSLDDGQPGRKAMVLEHKLD